MTRVRNLGSLLHIENFMLLYILRFMHMGTTSSIQTMGFSSCVLIWRLGLSLLNISLGYILSHDAIGLHNSPRSTRYKAAPRHPWSPPFTLGIICFSLYARQFDFGLIWAHDAICSSTGACWSLDTPFCEIISERACFFQTVSYRQCHHGSNSWKVIWK